MRYNKGEWSEAYVFLKILGDGKVTAGNSNEGDFYPILTVFKENECIVYKIIHNDQKSYETDHVCIERVDKKGIKKISSKELISKYSILLNKIEEGKGRCKCTVRKLRSWLDVVCPGAKNRVVIGILKRNAR